MPLAEHKALQACASLYYVQRISFVATVMLKCNGLPAEVDRPITKRMQMVAAFTEPIT